MKNNNYFVLFLVAITAALIAVVYHIFFTNSLLSSGDFPYFSQLELAHYPYFLSAWANTENNGFGVFYAPLSWPSFLFGPLTALLADVFHFSWNSIGRILYFFPFLILGSISIYLLAKRVLKNNLFTMLSVLIYLCNTYIILLVGGGQLLYIVGYALSPLVLWSYIRLIEDKVYPAEKIIFSGLITGILLMIDPRIFYMLLLVLGCYWVFSFMIDRFSWKTIMKKTFLGIFIPLCLAIALNSFWVIPTLLVKNAAISTTIQSYTTISDLRFFSFATFENTLGLLHPNWPDNIFGKVYFMRPEFLILPILAFLNLIFTKSKIKNQPCQPAGRNAKLQFKNKNDNTSLPIEQDNNVTIIFFVFLGLFGTFLAKGVNPPLGFLYQNLFTYLAGFNLFRDPTKWYLLIALSYAVLIPNSLQQLSTSLQEKQFLKKIPYLQYIFCIAFIVLFGFLTKEALTGRLHGMYRSTTVPEEYQQLEKYLSQDTSFSRVLWVPSQQRFGYSSASHPAVNAQVLLKGNSITAVISQLQNSTSEQLIQESAIAFIIVPDDTQKEIYMKGKNYDPSLYTKTVQAISQLPWVSPVHFVGYIAVFEVTQPKDHLWIQDNAATLHYIQQSPVSYTISVTNAKKGDRVVFSESFDPHWEITMSQYKGESIKYNGRFNSFVLPEDGSYTMTLYYTSQRFVDIGLWVSGITLFVIAGYLMFSQFRSS